MNLVVGATGSLGSEIVKLLADAGKPSRALVRPTSDQKKVHQLQTLGAEIVSGDLKDRPSLDPKREVERHLKESGMTYTILQPTFFMEVWLSPALGFDAAQGTAQVYGSGESSGPIQSP